MIIFAEEKLLDDLDAQKVDCLIKPQPAHSDSSFLKEMRIVLFAFDRKKQILYFFLLCLIAFISISYK